MKWKGRRQSDNFQVQTPKEKEVAVAQAKQIDKAINNPRTLVNEPIEFNEDKSPKDIMLSTVGNPGRPRADVSLKTHLKRANDGKAPLDKDAKFFKHDIKDN